MLYIYIDLKFYMGILMKRFLTLLILITFVSSAIAANIFTEVKASPGTNRVTLSWLTKTENGVSKFVILRSNDDVSYIELDRINPKGPGSRYEYVDTNVIFKGVSPLYYKIRAVGSNNKFVDESSLFVLPNVNSIFRTWGTIKAMFR